MHGGTIMTAMAEIGAETRPWECAVHGTAATGVRRVGSWARHVTPTSLGRLAE
jgi:hypothetical protein